MEQKHFGSEDNVTGNKFTKIDIWKPTNGDDITFKHIFSRIEEVIVHPVTNRDFPFLKKVAIVK